MTGIAPVSHDPRTNSYAGALAISPGSRRLLLAFSLLAALFVGTFAMPARGGELDVAVSERPATRALAVSGNASPSLSVPATIEADEGSTLSIEVNGADADASDLLTLTQASPPALGLKLSTSATSGLVLGTLGGALGFDDAGTYQIFWSLGDGVNPPVAGQSTLTVRDVPPPPGAPPVAAFPQDVLQGVRTTIAVKGESFGTSTWVELQGKKGTVPADTVVILSSTTLVASVLVPASMAGQYDIVVTGPNGEQRLPSGVVVSTYQIEAIDPATGQPVPHPVKGPSLAPSASTAFQCEGINFCSVNAPVGVSPPSQCVSAGINPYFSATSLIYRIIFGGFNRKCWVHLHVRPLQELGGSQSPTGGHCHSDENRPLGAPVDTSGYTTDGTSPNFIVQHRWPEAAGRLEGVLWSTDPNCPGLADSLNGAQNYIYCLYAYPFFATGFGLRVSGPGDEPWGNPSQHPTNWGMIPGMAAALDSVSADWVAKFPSGPKLGFNDASLPWGGLFDAKNFNWEPDHCGHRVGAEMDIRSVTFTAKQDRWAETFFRSHNFIVHREKHPVHWHVYYAGSDTFRGPGSPITWAEQRYRR